MCLLLLEKSYSCKTLVPGSLSLSVSNFVFLSLTFSLLYICLLSIATGIVLFLEDSGARQSVVLELRFNLLSASRQQSPGWIKI